MHVTAEHEQDAAGIAARLVDRVLDNVGKVIVGKRDIVRLCIVAMISRGHILLEDVPGVGKTVMVRAIARSFACDFKRIQFTPDLLPSDVTGTSIFNQGSGAFEFRPGPIFAHVVLADEINRTSPKTQAALLEALEEHSVSFDGITRALPAPFFVLATQNPIEYEGTFPLPEAQLDRFLLKLSIGYPTPEEELSILARGTTGVSVGELQPVAAPEAVIEWQEQAAGVFVDPSLFAYIVDVAQRTRVHPRVYLGVSPRGSLALARASQAYALLAGRNYVIPDDIKYLAPHVLRHRLLLHPEARISGVAPQSVLQEILESTPVPVIPGRR